jgi:hypothetical protein
MRIETSFYEVGKYAKGKIRSQILFDNSNRPIQARVFTMGGLELPCEPTQDPDEWMVDGFEFSLGQLKRVFFHKAPL